MQYVSIDIETSGRSKERHDIVELALIADAFDGGHIDNPADPYYFQCFVHHDHNPWKLADADILEMHKASGVHSAWHRAPPLNRTQCAQQIKDVAVHASDLAFMVRSWLAMVGLVDREDPQPRINVAGKNIALFDWPWLCARIPNWEDHIVARRRMLDPGILYLRPTEDETLPDLSTCLQRAGLPDNVAHNALDDAQQVMWLLRHKFGRTVDLNPL